MISYCPKIEKRSPVQAAIRGGIAREFWMSRRTDETRTGLPEIEAAIALHPESGAWAFFMREIIKLPREMTPAVCQVIRLGRWRGAADPLEAIRSDVRQAHGRAWSKPSV
jgi:hypothetical protein